MHKWKPPEGLFDGGMIPSVHMMLNYSGISQLALIQCKDIGISADELLQLLQLFSCQYTLFLS